MDAEEMIEGERCCLSGLGSGHGELTLGSTYVPSLIPTELITALTWRGIYLVSLLWSMDMRK